MAHAFLFSFSLLRRGKVPLSFSWERQSLGEFTSAHRWTRNFPGTSCWWATFHTPGSPPSLSTPLAHPPRFPLHQYRRLCWRNHSPSDGISLPMTSHDFASPLTHGTSGSLCAERAVGFDGCHKLLAQAARHVLGLLCGDPV